MQQPLTSTHLPMRQNAGHDGGVDGGRHLQEGASGGGRGRCRMAAPPALAAALEGAFNDSQREAITAGLNSGSRLVLVQGPPGGPPSRPPIPPASRPYLSS